MIKSHWTGRLGGLLLLLFLLLRSGTASLFAQSEVDHNWLAATVSGDVVIDPNFAAITVDSQNQPHVAFRGAENDGALYYAFLEGDAWQTELVDTTPFGGQQIAIVVDGQDRPVISHTTDTAILVNRRAESGWGAAELIPTGDLTGSPGPTRLALAGEVTHLTFSFGDQLFYTTHTGGSWATPTAVASGGFYHDLALDSAGNPHLSYQADEGGLRYLEARNGVFGAPESVAEGDLVGADNALALSAGDRPHISYLDGDGLAYAFFDGAQWLTEPLALDAGAVALYSDIMLFDNGTPAISYYELDGEDVGRLRFQQRDAAGNWTAESIDGDNAGFAAALTRDGLERAQLAYIDSANETVKVAAWNWAPQARDDSGRVRVDGRLTIPILANDSDRDGHPLTAQVITPPANGSAIMTASGEIIYTPFQGYRGPDSLTYEVVDHGGLRVEATVSLTVYVPTLIFVTETAWWANGPFGSRIELQLVDGKADTWAGVQFFNITSGHWETVKAADGRDSWHGTADRGGQPWTQSWWLDQSLLDSGPYRWAIYTGEGGYELVYSEPFRLPALGGRTLMLSGRIASGNLTRPTAIMAGTIE